MYSISFKDTRMILGIIAEDLKKTGRCDFTIAKENFVSVLVGIVLPKNGPYTEEFSLA